jgi:putative transposase
VRYAGFMRYPDGGGLTAVERAPPGEGAAGGGGADRGRGRRPGDCEAVPAEPYAGEPVAARAGRGRPAGAGARRRGRGEVQADPGPAGRAGSGAGGRPGGPCGYAGQCWTLARIADQVWRRFGAEYTMAGMDVLLRRIGWSVQVPARRAAERDEARIAAWREEREERWPVVKGRQRTWAPGWSSRTNRARAPRAASRGFTGSGIHGTGTCSSSLSPGRTYQTPHAARGTHDVTTAADRRQYPPPSDAARWVRSDAPYEDGTRLAPACTTPDNLFRAAPRSREARSGWRALPADTRLDLLPFCNPRN